MAILVAVFADRGNNPTFRMVRCSMGFLTACIWIMVIADEVVNILQVRSFFMSLNAAETDSPDFWFHIRVVRCNHRLDNLRSRKLFSRSRRQYECCSRILAHHRCHFVDCF